MTLVIEASTIMPNVYNVLREACGVSQAEAAEFIHDTRLDSVKSWCSERRSAPQGVINDLQKLVREIHNSGKRYAAMLKKTAKGGVYIIGLPSDEQDARACGFPSVGAQMRAVAIAVSYLPENAEIRMVERVRGAIPAPILEAEETFPTVVDTQILGSMKFNDDGYFYSAGNVNRRKYNRLEELGWITYKLPNISDVEYRLTETGKLQWKLLQIAEDMQNDFPNPMPNGFQSIVNVGNRKSAGIKLVLNQQYQIGDLFFQVEKIDGENVTIRLSDGTTTTVIVPAILF